MIKKFKKYTLIKVKFVHNCILKNDKTESIIQSIRQGRLDWFNQDAFIFYVPLER